LSRFSEPDSQVRGSPGSFSKPVEGPATRERRGLMAAFELSALVDDGAGVARRQDETALAASTAEEQPEDDATS
jgi:hypothetical protein